MYFKLYINTRLYKCKLYTTFAVCGYSLPAHQLFWAKQVLFLVAAMCLCVCKPVHTKTKKLQNSFHVTWYKYVLWWTLEVIKTLVESDLDLDSYFRIFWIRKLLITWKLLVIFWHSFTQCTLVDSISSIKVGTYDLDLWPQKLKLMAAYRFVLLSEKFHY